MVDVIKELELCSFSDEPCGVCGNLGENCSCDFGIEEPDYCSECENIMEQCECED